MKSGLMVVLANGSLAVRLPPPPGNVSFGKPALSLAQKSESSPLTDKQLTLELLELGKAQPHTRGIQHILFHPSFPVDIRHNAKIFREKLAAWAAGRPWRRAAGS